MGIVWDLKEEKKKKNKKLRELKKKRRVFNGTVLDA